MNLQSKLTIFYQARPRFEAKREQFCGFSGKQKHKCVWSQTGVIPFQFQYHCIFNVHEVWDDIHRDIHNPNSPCLSSCFPFGGTVSSFVVSLAQETCVQGCRLGVYYSEIKIGSLVILMKPGMVIVDTWLNKPHHFLPSRSPFWSKTEQYC